MLYRHPDMSEERTRMVNVRMSETEMTMLAAVCDARGLGTSDVIRQLIRLAYADVVAKPPASPAPTKKRPKK